jgi:molybdopterin/thiamine biosynthesis adenylyltransferase
VADDAAEARRLLVHDALLGRGFLRKAAAVGSNRYEGSFQIGDSSVPIVVVVQDLDFVTYPYIGIAPDWQSEGRKYPHVLGPWGVICYFAAGAVVLDRYDPAGTILQCLNQAERVLRDALAGRLDADFAGEFMAYWGGTWQLSDLPRRYSGRGTFHEVKLSGDNTMPVLSSGKSWLLDRPGSSPSPRSGEPVHFVAVDEPLTLDPFAPWPPDDLAAVTDWLRWLDRRLVAELDAAIAAGTLPGTNFALSAPNGVFSLRVCVPTRLQTPEILTNRRKSLPKLLHAIATEVKVERSRTVAADLDYIYGRNLGSMRGLAGKRILQIGCGTIGSFLAQQLAQSGAGTGGGRFRLIDTDRLQPSNLGRHLLGVPHLNENKAVACAAFLNGLLPGAEIEGDDTDALTVTDLDRFDLVIDATGEEALSLTLNQRAVDRRPKGPDHLFVWLKGNGALAQAILVGDTAKACLKCLKTELAGQPRFRDLRPEVEVEMGSIQACGDADFIVFPVSRPVSAAALACDMVLDWANGGRGDRFRNITFDTRKAFEIADSSPAPTARCPACGTSH